MYRCQDATYVMFIFLYSSEGSCRRMEIRILEPPGLYCLEAEIFYLQTRIVETGVLFSH